LSWACGVPDPALALARGYMHEQSRMRAQPGNTTGLPGGARPAVRFGTSRRPRWSRGCIEREGSYVTKIQVVLSSRRFHKRSPPGVCRQVSDVFTPGMLPRRRQLPRPSLPRSLFGRSRGSKRNVARRTSRCACKLGGVLE
jgi:hypothetical protein